MKKMIALMTAGAMAVSMTACAGSDTKETTKTAGTEAGTNTEADTEAAEADEDLTGTITAAGSSALKPLVDDAADMFAEKYPNIAITIDAGGSGEGLKQVSEVGGPDAEIVLVTRPTSSGTRATFQKYALDGQEEASNAAMETDDSGVLLQNVKDTEGAIGYVALSYLTGDAGVSTLAIDGVEPTLENTYSGDYPVWTYEHMYTKGEPDEVTKTFIDYIMSDEYGEQMETLGYGVSSKMTVTEH